MVDKYEPALENLYLGRCDAAMLGKNEYLQFVKAQKGTLYVCTDEADGRWWSTCKDKNIKATEIRLECTCKDFSKSIEECPEECPHAQRYCPLQTTAPDFYFEFVWALPVLHLVQSCWSLCVLSARFSTAGGMIERSLERMCACVCNLSQTRRYGEQKLRSTCQLG